MLRSSGIHLIRRIRRIRQQKPTQRIVVVSAIEDTRVAVLAAEEGIEEYLTKPIDFTKLDELLAGNQNLSAEKTGQLVDLNTPERIRTSDPRIRRSIRRSMPRMSKHVQTSIDKGFTQSMSCVDMLE
jgi:DNA-binding response OmpR family regulator